MRIYVAESYENMSRKAANILSAQVILNPNSVLGLATGSTPIGMYKQLVSWYNKGDLDFSQVKSVNLDEYVGLAPDHDQSYRYFMNDNLFNHVNIDKEKTHVPNGLEPDADKACAAYNALLDAVGKVDVQVLGLGGNGHIGFNEPDERFTTRTHCVRLEESTIQANARFFASAEEVPTQAYTMGIGDIMSARKIIVIATGEQKAKALYDTICGPVTPRVPGSVLQLHSQVAVFADAAALSLVKEKQ